MKSIKCCLLFCWQFSGNIFSVSAMNSIPVSLWTVHLSLHPIWKFCIRLRQATSVCLLLLLLVHHRVLARNLTLHYCKKKHHWNFWSLLEFIKHFYFVSGNISFSFLCSESSNSAEQSSTLIYFSNDYVSWTSVSFFLYKWRLLIKLLK